MRQVKSFRIDESRTVNNEGCEIVLDTFPLGDARNAGEKSHVAADGGDVIAGLRNGLMLSAAFWLLMYFVVQLLIR